MSKKILVKKHGKDLLYIEVKPKTKIREIRFALKDYYPLYFRINKKETFKFRNPEYDHYNILSVFKKIDKNSYISVTTKVLNKDLLQKIMQELSDADLFKVIRLNSYFYRMADDYFWMNRLLRKYPNTVEYKNRNQSWTKYYFSTVYYMRKLNAQHTFKFTQGNPEFYFNMLPILSNPSHQQTLDLLTKGHEDLARYTANQIRDFFSMPNIEEKDWEDYKKHLEIFK